MFVVQIFNAVYEYIEQWIDGIYMLPFALVLSVTIAFVLIVVCLRQCRFNVNSQ